MRAQCGNPILSATRLGILVSLAWLMSCGSDGDGRQLTLSVKASPDGTGSVIRIVATIRNGGSTPVAYLTGCSASCKPLLYTAIYFTVDTPDSREAHITNPCSGPFFCPPVVTLLSPGDTLEQTLEIVGTQWDQEGATVSYCGTCSERPLDPGKHTVVARFRYSTNLDHPYPFPDEVAAETEFEWP